MTFAEKLQTALNNSGMTRSELADKAGISRPMITNYLKGGYIAKQNNIFRLAKALNISETDLIEDEIISNYSPTTTAQPSTTPPAHDPNDISHLPQIEQNLISTFRLLDDKGQASVQEQADLQLIRCKAKE